MRKFQVLFLFIICISCKRETEFFTGEILYNYSFSELNGKDITEQMVRYYGRENHFFINAKNYKSYNENSKITGLYNSSSNTYYMFLENNSVEKLDASKVTTSSPLVTKLPEKEKVLGYECSAINIESDSRTITYYYSPKVKVNPKPFLHHKLNEWGLFLIASDGALPLKWVETDLVGIIRTAVAVKIRPVQLNDSDFSYVKFDK